MKKTLKIIYGLIKIIILCIPFVLDYFGKNKMGMHRFLIAKTYIMENAIFTLQIILLIKVAAVLIFIVAAIYSVKKNNRAYVLLMSSIAEVVILFGSKFIASKVYYFYIICFGIVNIIYLVEMVIGLMIKNRKKGDLL